MAVIDPFRGWDIETVGDRHSMGGPGAGYKEALYTPSLQIASEIRSPRPEADRNSDHELRTDGGQDVVYVPAWSDNGGTPPSVHTDPDCPALQLARNVLEKDPSIAEYRSHCKICEGYDRHSGEDENRYSQRLQEANPEDLGLAPIGELPARTPDDRDVATDGGAEPCQYCDQEAEWTWFNGRGAAGRYCPTHARDELPSEADLPAYTNPVTTEENVTELRGQTAIIPGGGVKPIEKRLPVIRAQEAFDRFVDGEKQAATDGGLEEVFRRETIVETDDGIAIGAGAVPIRCGPEPGDVHGEPERGESR